MKKFLILCLIVTILLLVACDKDNSFHETEYNDSFKVESSNSVLLEQEKERESSQNLLEDAPLYKESLSDIELSNAENVVEQYYKISPYNGVVSIVKADNDFSKYNDEIIEEKYREVGNLIIFRILTQMDVDRGNPERFICLGRESKECAWQVITEGF